jgi:hypothetical protein
LASGYRGKSADAADLNLAASTEPGKSWPGLRGPVGTFVDVWMVMEPRKGDGSFDLVFEPPGLFVIVAIDAEEARIGLFEQFF